MSAKPRATAKRPLNEHATLNDFKNQAVCQTRPPVSIAQCTSPVQVWGFGDFGVLRNGLKEIRCNKFLNY